MSIPKKITLAGLDIETLFAPGLVGKRSLIGESLYHIQKIALDHEAAPTQTTEQAYVHEVVHWILFVLNRHELRTNEEFVDSFAHLLYQAMKTGLSDIGCHCGGACDNKKAPLKQKGVPPEGTIYRPEK